MPVVDADVTARCTGSCHDQVPDDGTCPECGSLDVALVCDDCAFYLAQDA